MKQKCKLCDSEEKLQQSHIIPNFVYKWSKRRFGHMRASDNPHKRIQDGYKEAMLCISCEQAFRIYENSFKSCVFEPLYSDAIPSLIPYDKHMIKFCVSLLWRTLAFLKLENGSPDTPEYVNEAVHNAFIIWKDFLLGKSSNTGKYKQYVIILCDISKTHLLDLPPFLSSFFVGCCDLDVCYSTDNVYVYTKIYKLLIASPLKLHKKAVFKAIHIRNHKDIIRTKFDITLPADLVFHLFNRCTDIYGARDQISASERQKINDYTKSRYERLKSLPEFNTYIKDYINSFTNNHNQ